MTGVVLSALGVYLLNVGSAHISLWEPLRVLFTDRGQRYTLLAAVLYAPSVITIKKAILASNTAVGTFGTYFTASLMVTPLVLTPSARHFAAVPRYWKEFVSYVEAVKQVEILYAMAIGVVAFGEGQRVRESALGAVVMLLGMVLLALAEGPGGGSRSPGACRESPGSRS